ncbi:tryptophan synthase subunit alpha [Neobacillus massiliamazoniensis]|jgi:tryptophan synthase alpha chain|uniref:Tryptophan synthase alpha chain n=1 Tax=Neobacillus massiliamazoniensis TaxID=1499688 RepID=A0A0U1P0F2_9BACI|nr:tryptophan synthase subunit alpha [Neobacillus massiliamazoniensis]CRK83755.1 tryptophan synthase subunit alpha [Neobacillus massiliamazoniensis]
MKRLERTFTSLKENGRKAIVPYIMGGDGGLECLSDRLIKLEKWGATAIEVGVPFSDPVADGPTIQKAGIRALENGTTLKAIIHELEKARDTITIPLILMTYMNPIYSYGIDQFTVDIQNAGVDGCIIPDLPLEEEEIVAPQLTKAGIELIRLVTPTTTLERIKTISSRGKGFLYAVTVKGITGTRSNYDQSLNEFLQTVKEVSSIPVLAGFGISKGAQMKELAALCDGVIIGSKVVELFEKNDLKELETLISVFRQESKIM